LFVSPLWTALALPGLVACGGGTPVERETTPSPDVSQYPSDELFADDYFVQDLTCQVDESGGKDGVATLGSLSVYQWQGSATAPIPYAFSGSSKDTLTAGPIAGSDYDYRQTARCDSPSEGSGCGGDSTTVQRLPRSLRICGAGAGYARTSVEGIALASLASLSTADAFYRRIPERNESLKPASLLVLPIVERTYTDGSRRQVTTDNLAYAPSFAGQPTFVVFPKGRRAESLGLWKGVNLWEVPWGLAHEYGHHVFRSHTAVSRIANATGAADEGDGMTLTPIIADLPAPDEEDGVERDAAGFALAERTVSSEDVWSSVNEGFADLFAFFALGGDADVTKGVDCFDVNRDVMARAFASGEPKSLSAEVLAQFYAPDTARPTSCKVPNFQDVHAIGAIIAHGASRLVRDVATSPTQAAGLLLGWADRLGAVIRQRAAAGATAKLTLDALIEPLLKVVAKGDGTLTATQCETVRDVFPVYADAWLGTGGAFRCGN
jgi:hypothetical protein